MIADVIQDFEHDRNPTGPPVTAVVDAYEATAVSLVRFATMLVGPNDAEDVVADALIRVLDRASADPPANPASYLFRAVSNTAKNHHRSRHRRVGRERRAAMTDGPMRRTGPTPAGLPAENVVVADGVPGLSPEVVAAVRRLSHQQRAVIFLTYWVDLAPADVAEHLGVSEGSVRKQLARARKRLGEVLDD